MKASKGHDFSIVDDVNDICNETNLEKLINSATFSDMLRSDFISAQRPIAVSGAEPSGSVIGDLWLNPSLNTPANPQHILSFFNGSNFVPIASGVYVKNGGGNAINAKDICRGGNPSSSPFQVSRSFLANDNLIVGVSIQDIAVDEMGFVITKGYAVANVSGTPVSWGSMRSSTAGDCTAAAVTVGLGSFGRVLDTTNLICYITGVVRGR